MNKSHVKQIRGEKYLKQIRLLLSAVLVGIGVGLAVSLFRFCIVHLSDAVKTLVLTTGGEPLRYLLLVGVILLFALIVNFSLKREPLIGGSGIPQVMGYLEGKMQFKWYKILFYKLVGGIIAIGSGLTVGREGPSVQVGASVGQGIGETLSKDLEIQRLHTIAGACSGIAVAFNTPISSLIFALEELKLRFNARNFMFLALSVLTANLVSGSFFGTKPIIELALEKTALFPTDYLVIALIGVIAGLSGVLFNKLILLGKRAYQRTRAPRLLKIIFPFLLSFLVILYNIEYFGSEEHLIFLPFSEHIAIPTAIEYYLVTLALIVVAFCSGVPGGIFFPMLVVGSLLGSIFGLLFVQFGILDIKMLPFIATIAMAAHFAAIVRSPMTGMLLVIEMTGAFTFMLPLVITCFFSYMTAELLCSKPIYESLLEQWLEQHEQIHNQITNES